MALGVLVLDELVVGRAAAESLRQGLLQRLDHVGIQDAHAAGRELRVAPHLAERRVPAEGGQRTAAGSGLDHRLVPDRDVEQHERRRRAERRVQQGARRQIGVPAGGRSGLDEGVQVGEQVEIGPPLRMETAVRDGAAALAASVGAGRVRPRLGDHPEPRGGDGFAGQPELRPAEREAGLGRRLAEAHGGAREREQMWHLAPAQHVRHPGGDGAPAPRAARTGPREAGRRPRGFPGGAPARSIDSAACSAGGAGIDLREPAGRRRARRGQAQQDAHRVAARHAPERLPPREPARASRRQRHVGRVVPDEGEVHPDGGPRARGCRCSRTGRGRSRAGF